MESSTTTRSPDEEKLNGMATENGGSIEPGIEIGGLEGEHEDEQPSGPPPLELEGLGNQLSLKINGGKPDVALATLQGGAIKVPAGEYNPGDMIEAVVRLRCTEVAIRDNTNHSTGEVSERARKHKFKLLSIERTS